MRHVIEPPDRDDALAIGQMQLAAWLETYPNPAAGIDEQWIRAQRGEPATPEGAARWREFIERAADEPEHAFCRVVRRGPRAAIAGVICGSRARPPAEREVTLGPMYLRAADQGRGLGRQLMVELLAWAEPDAIVLWATAYNEQALRFYRRHGFHPTGERELWRERLPNLRMRRPAAS
ncbi:GNAT family N-acetyltransferase [Kitasatospora sp. NBC_01287]|uniref:GNAT family N-acetyltransferase n=1 Tax=Kitasatospora sp. NBC_01287 TaxID=2903573 RepID=UPI0022564214|nr:GNAT family N-acetyltransferase [Kitasatospora sp. NBC_01287]MCX4751680.1 GNAT family N-acetyltransferase [Kitasatospora sp. NBC_01287]